MIIDVNVSLERWPLRRTPCDELPALLARLRKHGVGQAWAGSLDGVLHRDIGGVNRRLAAACHGTRDPHLVPFGTVNPLLPDWQEDLRRCQKEYRMPGVRLHPNYHGYKLDHPAFAELLDAAAARRLIVQIAVRLDDVRFQHPLLQVPDVDVEPLAGLLKSRPQLRIVLLNTSSVKPATLAALVAAGAVSVDIATREGIGGVATLLQSVALQRVLFGSHLPLFNLESAMLKLREAGLSAAQRAAIEFENAQRVLGE